MAAAGSESETTRAVKRLTDVGLSRRGAPNSWGYLTSASSSSSMRA